MVALVTGGTGAVGAAVVRTLRGRGRDVVFAFHRNDAAARALETETGARALQLDLRDGAAVATGLAALPNLDLLVNAAGPHVPQRHLSRLAPGVLAQQLLDDTAAVFALVAAALPALRTHRGAVVLVTTAATDRAAPRDGLSAIPKAALEALVRQLAVEEGRYGVRVNAVGPGMLTDGTAERLIASGDLDGAALEAARKQTPLGHFGSAQDVADAVCFLAGARFVTGQKLNVDGGYSC